MPGGTYTSIPQDSAGFKVDHKIKLLGMTVIPDLDNVDDFFVEIGDKVLKLIMF
jgi:hypothetical protein